MLNAIGNAAHKGVVLGLVGLTVSGAYTIGSGLTDLRAKRMAAEAASKAGGASGGIGAGGAGAAQGGHDGAAAAR